MYQLTTRVILGMLFVLAIPQFSAAQNNPRMHSWVSCIDVKPGLSNEYQEFMLDATKKVMQVKDPDSNRVAWSLMRSVIPAGEAATCDFLIVTIYAGFPKSSMSFSDRIKKVGLNESEYRAKRNSLSTLANRELWRRIVGLDPAKVGNYVRINLAKVHDWDEWTEIERDVWKPVAEEMAKGGKRVSWGAYRLVMPSGTSLLYDGGSVDVFADWDALGGRQGVGTAFEKVHPDLNMDLLGSRLRRSREFVRRDLYRVVGQVTLE